MAGRTTLQYGSNGSEVKELQQYLNNNGYSLSVDGAFGDKTLSAVKDYQQKNGLTVDGIVGNNTWGKLLGGNTSANSSASAPKLTATKPNYDTSKWDNSTKGTAASKAYEDAKKALEGQGSFTFSENEWLQDIKNNIKDYGEFSYDVNSDALYQQYADQYARQGKIASADVMGQAAAMTGGYGNSYAATVGNQAYQSYLQQLNDKVPELYQLALDRYNMGKQELYDQYGMLLSEYEREYGLYSDEYNKLLDSLGIARDDYYSGADMFYTEQSNKNNVLGQEFNDAIALWEADNNNYWREKEYDLNNRQVILQEKAYEDSKKTSAPTYGSSNGYITTIAEGDGKTQNTYTAKAPSNTPNTNNTSGITDEIRKKAATFTDNDALDAYLTSQYYSGDISYEEMGELMVEYEIPSLQNRNWTLSDDGGVNWFWGIDNNAKVKDQYNNEYSLDKLVDALVSEGMDKKDAKEYVKKLQKELGA